MATIIKCDGERGCEQPVSMIDNKGFGYCTQHGENRKRSVPTRLLRPAELKKLEQGGTIKYR